MWDTKSKRNQLLALCFSIFERSHYHHLLLQPQNWELYFSSDKTKTRPRIESSALNVYLIHVGTKSYQRESLPSGRLPGNLSPANRSEPHGPVTWQPAFQLRPPEALPETCQTEAMVTLMDAVAVPVTTSASSVHSYATVPTSTALA